MAVPDGDGDAHEPFPSFQRPRRMSDHGAEQHRMTENGALSNAAILSTSTIADAVHDSRCRQPLGVAFESSSSRSNVSDKHASQMNATTSSTITAAKSKPSSALPSVPAPRTIFDPWNTNSAGHQVADNRLARSTDWRTSRNNKLGAQYLSGLSGGETRVHDTVGVGSANFGKDGRKANGGWERGASGLRTGKQRSLMEVWGARKGLPKDREKSLEDQKLQHEDLAIQTTRESTAEPQVSTSTSPQTSPSPPPQQAQEAQIFAYLTFYINGSTAPLISDHKLKHLLASRGARLSISLQRKSVTHVVLGAANNGRGAGAGGGLAAGKMQKEIAKMRGRGVQFVGVEWILESIKHNKRLPEAGFAAMKTVAKAQGSVYGMFKPPTS